MLHAVMPVLHVRDSAAAELFYARLGFTVEFRFRPAEPAFEPCYMGLARDGVRLHLSSFAGDGAIGGTDVYIEVADVDALHRELVDIGIAVHPGHPVTQTWGRREMYVDDLDGNTLRFGQ